MSTPPPDAPTPLHLLAQKLRGYAELNFQPTPMGEVPPFASGTANGLEIAADQLDAALAAAAGPHRETARKLHSMVEAVYPVHGDEQCQICDTITTALAAARAQGWRTCPATGGLHEYENDTGPDDGYFHEFCANCHVPWKYVEPPRPEQGEGKG